MSQQTIGIGASANDGTGDPLRTAFTKANENFEELYLSQQVENVLNHGADPSGSGDASVAFNAAVAALNVTRGGIIIAPPGRYNLDNPVDFPGFADGARVAVHMDGAHIVTDNVISMFRRMPTDQTHAGVLIGGQFHFFGGFFDGTSQAGQKGFEFGCTYGSTMRGTHFQQLDVGFDGYFNLLMNFQQCRTTNCRTDSFVVQGGNWSGAGLANAQSNLNTFDSCRVFGAATQSAHFKFLDASGCAMRDCVSEGANPVNSVHFDDQGATVVKDFRAENLHCECTPSNAIFLLAGLGGGTYTFDGCFSQTATTFLDVSGLTGAAYFNIHNVPVVSSFSPAFAGNPGGATWFITGWGNGTSDLMTTAHWSGGVVPGQILVLNRHPTGQGFEIGGNRIYIGSTALGNRIVMKSPVDFPTYTVAALPTGIAGRTAFATNGRKNGEGAAAGTGVLVYHDGTAWRASDTGATVAA